MIEPNYDKSFERLPFNDAIEYLREKVGITSDEWRQIYEQWRDYAFTVAGVTRAEVLQDLQDALVEVLAEGKSLEDWRKEFRTIAADRGWTAGQGLSPWRVELIFRQNTQTAYSAGRYTQQIHPDVIESRPYWMYRHGDSRNPRPAHKALDGKVYPAGDPFWATCYPTNGFGCRCKVITLSQRDLARRGLSVDYPPKESVVIRDRASGGMIRVPAVGGVPIAEGGFATIPGANKAPFEDALNKMPPGLRALMEKK
jgi:SPP1 gp7 family putative phage head morphogenesis protein